MAVAEFCNLTGEYLFEAHIIHLGKRLQFKQLEHNAPVWFVWVQGDFLGIICFFSRIVGKEVLLSTSSGPPKANRVSGITHRHVPAAC